MKPKQTAGECLSLLTFDLCRYVLIDTPGQIEVFTWSASGTIITEALVGPSQFVWLFVGHVTAASRVPRLCVAGVVLPLRRHLRDGHVPQRQPRHLHVQHAVRLQVR